MIRIFVLIVASTVIAGCLSTDFQDKPETNTYVFKEIDRFKPEEVNLSQLYKGSTECEPNLKKQRSENEKTKEILLKLNSSLEEPAANEELMVARYTKFLNNGKKLLEIYVDLCATETFKKAHSKYSDTTLIPLNEKAKTLVRLKGLKESDVPRSILLDWMETKKYNVVVKWKDSK